MSTHIKLFKLQTNVVLANRGVYEQIVNHYATVVAERLDEDPEIRRQQLSELLRLGVPYCQAWEFHRGEETPVGSAEIEKSKAMATLREIDRS